jgi:predicted Zn-dependent protease
MKWWRRIGLAIALLYLSIALSAGVSYPLEVGVGKRSTQISSDRLSLLPLLKEDKNSLDSLPVSKIHPLPESLANWNDRANSGDYFSQVKSTPLGYLVWSQFPIKVYLDKPKDGERVTASISRWQAWVETVRQGIGEWNAYLPLVEVADKSLADIIVERSEVARDIQLNPDTRLYDIPRAIAAQTTYDFYLRSQQSILAHRMTVRINPASVGRSLLATVRHEFGHALGIWGHSPQATDALYYSQVRQPLSISPRDINTLKKIYQQPTKLGWKIERNEERGIRLKEE